MNKDPTGDHPDAYFVAYVIFVLWAVAFSALCVAFVRMFAPYACGELSSVQLISYEYVNFLSLIFVKIVGQNDNNLKYKLFSRLMLIESMWQPQNVIAL